MIEKFQAFNRYIKSNTLHRDYYKDQSKLQRLVLEHTKYYRNIQVIDSSKSKELIDEIAIFEDSEYHISECLKYHNYILELYQLASKMDDTQYAKSVETLLLCADTYKAFIQIEARNMEIQRRLDLLKAPKYNLNYKTVIKEYDKRVDNEQFEREQRYTNVTPYNFIELSEITKATGLTIKTNMLFDEIYVADDLMAIIEMLGGDTREFNRLLQELIIVDNEATPEIKQVVSHTLNVVNIQKVSPKSLEIITITQDLFNDIVKKNPEYVLRLAYIKRLVYDTAFISDSNTILKESKEANNDLTNLLNKLTESVGVLNDFKTQKENVSNYVMNDQNPYIVDYPNTIKGGARYREPEALTLNQMRALDRDRIRKMNESIDNSILEWSKKNPLGLDGLNQDRLKNIPLNYKYMGNAYRNTTSEFDELFQDKIFTSIVAVAGLYNTNLTMVQRVIDTVIGLLQGLLSVATAVIQGVLNTILAALQAIKCLLKAIACAIGSVISTIKDVLGKVLPILKNLGGVSGLTEGMKNLPGAIYEAIKNAVSGIVKEALGEATKEIERINNKIKEALGSDIAKAFTDKSSMAKAICESKMTKNLMDKLTDFAKSTFDEAIGKNIKMATSGEGCPSLLGNLNMGIGLGSLRMKRIGLPDLNGRMGGC